MTSCPEPGFLCSTDELQVQGTCFSLNKIDKIEVLHMQPSSCQVVAENTYFVYEVSTRESDTRFSPPGFFTNFFPLAPEYPLGPISNFDENLRRY